MSDRVEITIILVLAFATAVIQDYRLNKLEHRLNACCNPAVHATLRAPTPRPTPIIPARAVLTRV